jgi:hypothetical protein
MSDGPMPDGEAVTMLKAFGMCETFGWTLGELGIPEGEKKKFVDAFMIIINERNKKQESENRLRELKMRGRNR